MTTYEEVAQGLVTCFEAAELSRFAAGDILAALPEDQSLKELASTVGRSTSFLSSLRQVARAFPPSERAQDQSWSLHLVAARTTDPEGFLEKAVCNAWSVRQLTEYLVEIGEVEPRTKKEKADYSVLVKAATLATHKARRLYRQKYPESPEGETWTEFELLASAIKECGGEL